MNDPVQRCCQSLGGVIINQQGREPMEASIGRLLDVAEQHDSRSCLSDVTHAAHVEQISALALA